MSYGPLTVKLSPEEMEALNRDGAVPAPRRRPNPIVHQVCMERVWAFAKAVGLPRTFKTRCLLSSSYGTIKAAWASNQRFPR